MGEHEQVALPRTSLCSVQLTGPGPQSQRPWDALLLGTQ
ncbi:CCDC159 isoform 16 [Pan troglodytes]|uniref:CCDC159 isoform 16 n=1 Tax=Pan troglodytes TaxID=9598 RepID=A0A2J8LVX0_PANTR|nr:CCDC159 isoform 16 [Pan troglodytes]